MKRRDTIKIISAGVLGSTLPFNLQSQSAPANRKWVLEQEELRVLFQGDSITDAGRERDIKDANNPAAMGDGYPFLASCQLMKEFPGRKWSFYNRGVSGDKAQELIARWKEDSLDLKPNVLSILVGVNDYYFDRDLSRYRNFYTELLETQIKKMPDCKLMIGEPFLVKGGSKIEDNMVEELSPHREAARELAIQYNATFIPYQSYFDAALKEAPASYWCPDGVHPSMAGNELMAEAWLNSFYALS